jgi:hypothetical protein
MFGVHIEMPSGAKSRPHESADRKTVEKIFDSFAAQMQKWPKFRADVVLMDGKTEIEREHIENA